MISDDMSSEPQMAEITLAPPKLPAESGMRVLVVEDDRPTRLLLERMIRLRGNEVLGCDCAETALDLLGREFFPLIVLDIQLPGMSGLEFRGFCGNIPPAATTTSWPEQETTAPRI